MRRYICDEEGCDLAPCCPMLHDELWATISTPNGLLCIKHAEARLGREIEVTDLNDSLANAFTFKLYDRLKAHDIGS